MDITTFDDARSYLRSPKRYLCETRIFCCEMIAPQAIRHLRCPPRTVNTSLLPPIGYVMFVIVLTAEGLVQARHSVMRLPLLSSVVVPLIILYLSTHCCR